MFSQEWDNKVSCILYPVPNSTVDRFDWAVFVIVRLSLSVRSSSGIRFSDKTKLKREHFVNLASNGESYIKWRILHPMVNLASNGESCMINSWRLGPTSHHPCKTSMLWLVQCMNMCIPMNQRRELFIFASRTFANNILHGNLFWKIVLHTFDCLRLITCHKVLGV